MTAFPTSAVGTSNLDSGADKPADARADLLTLVQRVNTIMDSYGDASGLAPLNSLGKIDTSYLSAIPKSSLASDCIDGTKIEDDAIDSEHIANASVDFSHISFADTNTSLGSSDVKVPTQNAVKAYVDNKQTNALDIIQGHIVLKCDGDSVGNQSNMVQTSNEFTDQTTILRQTSNLGTFSSANTQISDVADFVTYSSGAIDDITGTSATAVYFKNTTGGTYIPNDIEFIRDSGSTSAGDNFRQSCIMYVCVVNTDGSIQSVIGSMSCSNSTSTSYNGHQVPFGNPRSLGAGLQLLPNEGIILLCPQGNNQTGGDQVTFSPTDTFSDFASHGQATFKRWAGSYNPLDFVCSVKFHGGYIKYD